MYLSLRGVFMSLSRLWVSSHHSVCTDAHQGVLFSTGPLHWLLLLHRAQTAVVCVWARWGQRGYCYHHARPLKGGCTVHKVCWLTIIPSLSSSFFFYPHEVETASHWWTMLLLWWTIKTEKIRAELPSVRQHVYLCWYSCVCVCVSVCVWVCLALFNLEPYIFKVTP